MNGLVTVAVTSVLSQMSHGAIFVGRTEEGSTCRVVVHGAISPLVGETWQIAGNWRDDTTHGRQLHCDAETCRRTLPSGNLIVAWLQRFPGIGHERARHIAQHFRGDLERAFGGNTPLQQLAELIAPDRPNLSARLAAAIVGEWTGLRAEYETIRWLEENGVEDPGLARKVAQPLGPNAVDILARNPYVLATVLSWRKVDELGQAVLGRHSDRVDVTTCAERVVGAVDESLQREVRTGHTAIARSALSVAVSSRLAVPPRHDFDARLERLAIKNRAIVVSPTDPEIWRAPGCAIMEDELEQRFARMARGDELSQVGNPREDVLRQRLRRIEAEGRQLHPEQRQAVLKLVRRNIACLVGGAGTGKTTTLLAVVQLFEALGGRVEIAALAGKAALRAMESTGNHAWTIHRLLEGLKKRRNAEARCERPDPNLPLLDDRTLLVIDEASMVDLGQWHGLLDAMPLGCRLLMCGDPMQLPPIGFGLVFHHLADMNAITARLETIHRQTFDSGIPHFAKAIRSGSKPTCERYKGVGTGVTWYGLSDGEDVGEAIEKVAIDLGGFDSTTHALQIIAPLNDRGSGSVLQLNRRFHALQLAKRNLDPNKYAVKGHLGQYFAAGDPITYLKNDYSRGLWNGSLGRVVSVDIHSRKVVAVFGGKEHRFDSAELINLGLAYAVTCHRAQGSSARRVIIPIVESRLLDPSWIYTAVTRAEEQAVLVGRPETLDAALRRLPAWRRRITGCNFAAVSNAGIARANAA